MNRLLLLVLLLCLPTAIAHGAEHSGPGAYDESPDQPFVAGRLMLYAGLAASLGAALMLLLGPPDGHRVLLQAMAGGAAVQVAALLQLSALEAQYLEVGLRPYLGSAEGVIAGMRVLLSLLLAAIAWTAWKRLGPWRTLTRIAVGLLAFLAWMQAALSHADGRTTTAIALDWIHLVTAGMWLGGLAGYLWLAWSRDLQPTFRRRWSNTALVLAITFLGTGIANAFQSLGAANLAQPGLLWDYPYGRSLLLKSGAVLIVLGLASMNRLAIHRPPRWMRLPQERHAVLAEALAGIAVLVMASLLVSSAPLPDDFNPLDYETFEQDIRGDRHIGIAYIVPYPQVDEEQLIAFDIQNRSTGRTIHWSQISFSVTSLDTDHNRTYQAEHRGGPLAGTRDTFFPESGRYLIEVFVLDGADRTDRLSLGIQVAS